MSISKRGDGWWISYMGAGLALIAGVFYVVVFSHIPLSIWVTAMHDDGLFISHARQLAGGHWFGPFSQFTLMKGPGYAVFLAFNSWSGFPISVTEAAFHCIATAFFAWVVYKLSGSRLLALSLFLLTLWHPLFLTRRVIRDAIYPGQVLLVFACLLYSLFVASTVLKRCLWGAATGAMFGWCWLTREEGYWLLPGIGILLVVALQHLKKSRSSRTAAYLPAAAAVLAFAVSQFAFQLGNRIAYGSFVGVDFKEKNFQSALAALQSVRDGNQLMYLPVSRTTREHIYSVSPAFASLKNYLDPPTGSPWPWGCQLWPWTCGDIAGGWFMWALRDAAATMGHYQSPAKAAKFFGQVAREVTTACDTGRLRCERSLIPYMPQVTREQISWIPAQILEALAVLTFQREPPIDVALSTGDRQSLAQAVAFLNYPLHTASADYPPRYLLSGWYYDRGNSWVSLDLKRPDGMTTPIALQRQASPDIATHFGDPRASSQRLAFQTDCGLTCSLVFTTSQGVRREISIGEVVQGSRHFGFGGAILHFDAAFDIDEPLDMHDVRLQTSRTMRAALSAAYKATLPALLGVGFLAFVTAVALAWKRKTVGVIFALAASAWMLIAVRIAVLVLIAISSFPAVNIFYMMPATYLLPSAALLSVRALAAFVGSRQPTVS